jgi:predicted CXXCH cytochrome family protein
MPSIAGWGCYVVERNPLERKMKRGNASVALWLCAAVILVAVAFAGTRAGAESAKPSKAVHASRLPTQGNAATAPSDSDYVGAETCKTCHEDQYNAYMMEPMRQTITDTSLPLSLRGCEGCHGPGAAHVQDPSGHPEFNFSTAPPGEKAAKCLACHQKDQHREVFNTAIHKTMGVSCDECHDPHLVISGNARERVEPSLAQSKFFRLTKTGEQNRWLDQRLLRKPQPDLCFTCHATIQAAFALPTHHRVPEGLMKCTDCHNPHGTENRTLLTKANWETCVGCHTEKRGPWLFEHPSVKVEGCIICHNPHGSTNRMMTKAGEVRFLCLSCHANATGRDPVPPYAANVPHSPQGFQTSGDCTRCHAAIHGSNSSDVFLY